jgi:hypothetical protein
MRRNYEIFDIRVFQSERISLGEDDVAEVMIDDALASMFIRS